MFGDPQEITINSLDKVLARILIDGQKAVYATPDELFTFTISHQRSGNRTRSMVRVDQKAIVTNPLDSTNDYDTLSFYFVIDRPDFGFSVAQVEQLITGLKSWLTTTAIGQLYGREV